MFSLANGFADKLVGEQEIHYNQHGLLLLQGKGIYRLADKW
jgi:glyoxylate utilization-related uncharacterized protein